MTCGSVVVSKCGSGPVEVFSDSVFARAHGWYGMSSSLPRFLPPMSERLRLCPMPPRERSGSQSPDKSATRAVFWAETAGPTTSAIAAATSAMEDAAKMCRMFVPLLRSQVGRWIRDGGRAGHRIRRELLAVGQHDPVQRPDRRTVPCLEDVGGHLVPEVQGLPRPAALEHDERRFGVRDPLDGGALLIGRVDGDLVVRVAPVELRDRARHFHGFRHVVKVGAVVREYDPRGGHERRADRDCKQFASSHRCPAFGFAYLAASMAAFGRTSLSSNTDRPSSQLTVQRNGILTPDTSR